VSKLKRITFTGLDDYTNIDDLVKIENDFPHLNIEWGILFSAATRPRYPSAAKAKEATTKLKNCAAHLCGKVFDTWYNSYYEEFFLARERELEGFQRVQLNFNNQHKPLMPLKLHSLMMMYDKEFILQYNKANKSLIDEMVSYKIPKNWTILFDASGGRGTIVSSWPAAIDEIECSYAGGLGPDNLMAQLGLIKDAANGKAFGVDMESNIRTNDRFDVVKIEQCCVVASLLSRKGAFE